MKYSLYEMAMTPLLVLILSFGSMGLVSCTPHMGEYVPRMREYKPSVQFAAETETPSEGAIWTPNRLGNFLFADQRAMRVGDIVTIEVRETADARRGASTTLDRKSEMSNTISGFLGLIKYLKPDLKAADLLGAKTANDFKGAGETSRTERFKATVPATVKSVMPNGNLFVEGYRVILVNREEHRFYISGIIRPVDISEHNTIPSTKIAEAEIGFTGRGVISDKQGPGVLSRGLDQYNPF
jgi:flagellar L-ring protein precursor FlgH